jgi:hypothetical protein
MACLEARTPCLSAAAANRYPTAVKALKEAGLLRLAGHARAVTSAADHDDATILASWSPADGRYGYFTAGEGWTLVADGGLTTWEINLDHLFLILTSRLDIRKREAPLIWVADHLWELGTAYIGKRATVRR